MAANARADEARHAAVLGGDGLDADGDAARTDRAEVGIECRRSRRPGRVAATEAKHIPAIEREIAMTMQISSVWTRPAETALSGWVERCQSA